MQDIYEEIKENIEVSNVVFFVVGNKNDLYENEKITKEEAKKYAKSIKAEYMCVSALTPCGIEELFEAVATKLLKRERSGQDEISLSSSYTTISIQDDNKNKKKEKINCCSKKGN